MQYIWRNERRKKRPFGNELAGVHRTPVCAKYQVLSPKDGVGTGCFLTIFEAVCLNQRVVGFVGLYSLLGDVVISGDCVSFRVISDYIACFCGGPVYSRVILCHL